MSNSLQPEGSPYVRGTNTSGQLILIRSDGSVEPQPVVLMKNAELVYNDDHTYDIQFTEE